MKRAIVLSGGGSKGAYQIGVWRALRKMHIKYDIVTGTSVGALNAALMTQKTYYKALKLWKNISFNDVIDSDINDNAIEVYLKNITNGGMKTTRLEKTIEKTLNLNKLYRSKIDMGIITVNAETLKPLMLTKKQIPKEKFNDYLAASAACFPAFQKKEVDGKNYIDGGYFDNLPINLALDMGALEIIAVDLKEVGIKRRPKDKDINIVTISPRNDMGSFLIFKSKIASRAIRLGYNDTMKTYKKLDGKKYTFKKNHLIKNFEKYSPKFMQYTKKMISFTDFNKIVENLGYIFKIDDSYIYDINKYNRKIIDEFKKIDDDKDIISLLKNNKLKKLYFNKNMVKYIYQSIKDDSINELYRLFKNEYRCALYMVIVMEEL